MYNNFYMVNVNNSTVHFKVTRNTGGTELYPLNLKYQNYKNLNDIAKELYNLLAAKGTDGNLLLTKAANPPLVLEPPNAADNRSVVTPASTEGFANSTSGARQ